MYSFCQRNINNDGIIAYFSNKAIYKPDWEQKSLTVVRKRVLSERIGFYGCGAYAKAVISDSELLGACAPGPNALELNVTNCWANRLIGDSKLPEGRRKIQLNAAGKLKGS